MEAQIGRKLELVRVFELWNSPFPDAFHNEVINGNRRMLLSVRAIRENGTVVTWRSIADAQPGSQIHNDIVAWAQRVKAVNAPVWFTFNHEPEFAGNIPNGTDQDFKDAWRKVRTVFDSQGVTNAEYVWIMTDHSFVVPSSDRRQAIKWYPGDDVVDHIAADAYNWSDCRPGQFNEWRSLQEIVEPLRTFGASHPDKGLILAEWASTTNGGNKASWINDAANLFKQPGWEQFIAVAYWNDIYPASLACEFLVTSSSQVQAAFAAMANDPFYAADDNPTIGDEAENVIVISVDALASGAISTLGTTGAPNLSKMISEGASTLNARTVFELTQTLPNHSSEVTGRRVSVPGGHGVTFNEDDGLTIHASAGSYVASIFDLVHDAGGSTRLLAGKPKFDFLDRSWNGANGAFDFTGIDNGRDKIDTYSRQGGAQSTQLVLNNLSGIPATLTFVHYAEPDAAVHDFGVGSAQYLASVSTVDGWVGQILTAIENNPGLADSTIVILTADHGATGTDHSNPALAGNYTIPFLVWGAGVSAADLYTLNSASRTNPGTGRPNYTDPAPIRNAETANLVMDLLGLNAVPGSTINSGQTLDVN